MNRIIALTLGMTLLCSTPALAQGSGSTPTSQPSRSTGSERPFDVERTVKGTIAALDVEDNRLVVEDKKGKRVTLKLSDDTKYKADKKTELADRKTLAARDFKQGHLVRVRYSAEKEIALEVRLASK